MPTKSQKILVIEDEKPMASALEAKLKHEGYDVLVTSNGVEGLSAIKDEKFDLILCDLIMPIKDGFHVLESLKSSKNRTPVIILTNLSQQEDEKKVRDLGAKDFLIKSNISLSEIISKVKHFIA